MLIRYFSLSAYFTENTATIITIETKCDSPTPKVSVVRDLTPFPSTIIDYAWHGTSKSS
jgi:hypothetical protein